MAWATPKFSRGAVNRAGDFLVNEQSILQNYAQAEDFDGLVQRLDDEYAVINNWRASHSYPLQCMKMTLKNRAIEIDPNAVIAQRLKRLSSIAAKLERFPNMKFSQMQDIGGCRAVVSDVNQVRQLVAVYEESWKKNPNARMEFSEKYDYMIDPKADGYRGVHLVYKYRTQSPDRKVYNGLRIEIQLRSYLQHAWATAVEIVSTVTGQQLKSNIGTDDWKRFFLLMSSAIALREESPTVPNTPPTKVETRAELHRLDQRLNIAQVLSAYSTIINQVPEMVAAGFAHYLVVLDSETRQTTITSYRKEDLAEASEEYLRIEKSMGGQSTKQAVLASVDSVAALHKAYPNYFLDTKEFIKVFREVLK